MDETTAPTRACRRCGCTDADCRQCVARTGKPCSWVEDDLCSACTPIVLPDQMTAAIGEVLGMMVFRSGPLAHIYRAAGFDIPRKCEDEQAFILHRFLPLAILHGDAWWDHSSRDIDVQMAKVKDRTPRRDEPPFDPQQQSQDRPPQ